MTTESLVQRFQCPGCVCGSGTKSGCYEYSEAELRCTKHVLGTIRAGAGNFALGLPKGFCRPGFDAGLNSLNKMSLRLWSRGNHPQWDFANIAVWAMEMDGFLFVRTYAPRLNFGWVDIIEGGTLSLVPLALDVAGFLDTID